MKSCPLCSACSWGPIKNETLLPAIVPQILEQQPLLTMADFVRCDNCGQIAQQALLEEPIGSTFPPGFGAPAPSPIDTALLAMPTLINAIQATKPTRTERLLHSVLRANPKTQVGLEGVKTQKYAEWAVECTRALEVQLDKDAEFVEGQGISAGCTADGGGGIHWQFASRETFVHWLLPKLDLARDHCVEEGLSNFNINRVAKFVADEVFTASPAPQTSVAVEFGPDIVNLPRKELKRLLERAISDMRLSAINATPMEAKELAARLLDRAEYLFNV